MSEMSDMFKLVNQMELAKKARVGMELTYFDVIELLGEIKSLYEYIDVLESAQRWVPVSERLPEKKGYYMTAVIDGFDGSRSVEKFRYFGDGEFFAWSERYTVTHWMPLPSAPESEDE